MSTWSNQNSIFINLPTDQLLAITAYGEAGNQGSEGMQAVISVIRNRTTILADQDTEILGMTSDPIKAVILKPYQFSMYNLNDPVRQTALKIAANFNSYLLSNGNLALAYQLAQSLLGGTLPDNTGGADYYYNPSVVTPSWASSFTVTGQIGDHLFLASGKVIPYASPAPTVVAAAEPTTITTEDGETVEVEPTVTLAGMSGTAMILLVGAAVGLIYTMFIRRK